ncbi:hypothetical protein CC1G_05442 [Coprinopsis cinerea okayama7|uniref:F-box domain-containing protein n=1 Tax=Coprinopsis cinerea (strain Okayama-7 / 130 / ATCC MYA-4618 / FGSC 9003) TaxID=240176 RepID=A8NQ47_COPC7|nr:hypothetical protein CC1G_05442 [Coprinopsis cinerea okayama7\|eukprot:XP_001835480.2 hypothetical protein CC1G_05442 [Coprinopsis cinerea okayama7\
MDARCRDALAGTAPLLRRLRIFQTSYEYTEAVGIFQGGAPMLSTLILKDCYLPWTSPLFHPGLTTLQIRLPNNDPPHFAPEHLIDALGRVSSSLVVFELDPLPEVQFPVSRQVVLRKLEKLTLGCQRVEAIQSLFSHLIIPEKAVVHLSFESSPPMDVRMAHTRGDAPKPQSILPLRFFNTDILPPSELQACPSSHLLAYTALPPRSLCLDLRETAACTTYTFNLWDHHVDFSLNPLPTSSLRCTVEDTMGYQQRWDTPPVEVFPCLSSREIRSLSLNELPDMPLRRFEKLMSTSYSPSPSLSGVEGLYVVRRLSYRVVEFLMGEVPSGPNVGPPSGPPKILPLLRSLTFERIEFIEASRHRRPTINQIANGKPVVFEDLLQVLEFRAKSGTMIETLRLMECYNLSVIQAEKLAQFVGEMAWNGETFSRGSTPKW